MKTKLFLLIHENKYGDTPYLFRAESEPSTERACQELDIEFEPERGEYISITEMDENKIKVIRA